MPKLQYRAYSKKSKRIYSLEDLLNHRAFDLHRLLTHQYEDLFLVSSTGIFLNSDETPDQEIFEGDVLKVSVGGTIQTDPYVVTSAAELYAEINNSDSYYRLSVIERITSVFDDPSMLNYIYVKEDADSFMNGEYRLP